MTTPNNSLILIVAIKLHWEERWEYDDEDGRLYRVGNLLDVWLPHAHLYASIRRDRPGLPYGVRRQRAERVVLHAARAALHAAHT